MVSSLATTNNEKVNCTNIQHQEPSTQYLLFHIKYHSAVQNMSAIVFEGSKITLGPKRACSYFPGTSI